MTKKWKKRLIAIGVVIIILFALGAVGIVNIPAIDKLTPERNDQNMIKLRNIESDDVTSYGVTYDVDRNTGVVKLTGKATRDLVIEYAWFELLSPGDYSLSGDDGGSESTYMLSLYSAGEEIGINADGTYHLPSDMEVSVSIVIKKGTDFGVFGAKLYPVLCDADKDVTFWVD